ncbi:MAG: hypothetical protein WDW38_002919 [Sanguina aurantia]
MPSQQRTKKSNSTKYYELLCVDKNATQDEIKKAHRKLALKCHPDKGGDPAKFQEINEAYDVLKNEEKRQIYDQYGEDAIKEGMGSGGGGGGGGGMADIFDLFGGGGGGRGRQRERRSEDVVHKLVVSLEELYSGATKKLSLARNLPCDSCRGSGSKSGKKYECQPCRGQGIQVHVRPIGPGMMQQFQSKCGSCNGAGFSTPPSDQCPACKGKCLVSEKKTFEIHIEPGMKNNHKITLSGEAGCSEAGLAAGDVVLIVTMREHDVFQRMNCDLVMEQPITLAQALCTATFYVKQLDGTILKIHTDPGDVIKPDTFKCVRDKGMPVHGRPYQFGNLYVRFRVKFPERLDAATIAAVSAALPMPPAEGGFHPTMDLDDAEEVTGLTSVGDINDELKGRTNFGKGHGTGTAYDEDEDEDPRGGQRVQCAQQ